MQIILDTMTKLCILRYTAYIDCSVILNSVDCYTYDVIHMQTDTGSVSHDFTHCRVQTPVLQVCVALLTLSKIFLTA